VTWLDSEGFFTQLTKIPKYTKHNFKVPLCTGVKMCVKMKLNTSRVKGFWMRGKGRAFICTNRRGEEAGQNGQIKKRR
jgi:hypothetical protein